MRVMLTGYKGDSLFNHSGLIPFGHYKNIFLTTFLNNWIPFKTLSMAQILLNFSHLLIITIHPWK